ncbi:DUF4124 domain-containing protein [Wenzhouxiangella sediminis]|uniref:DUF4124 domain-containing protein n=1 Tax=Wenzhouxiangella sediminis TaxID=1792836 RepID=A0A3E1K816_9GAMM|nr:DUF4124 domain-containing protein [Wenzhouxiangella sediminis]RFF30210.1 DUF4124 domain-containing protein [Wenzhouxiangella sediminis]
MKSLTILLITLVLAVSPLLAQEIYRVVDENGNVTYTDQKPSDDAEPMELPELNVLEGDLDETGENPLADAAPPSMNFRIEQPAEGAVFTPQGGNLEVAMGIAIEVPPTAQIVLVLDGTELAPVRSLDASIPAPEPGEHRLFARLETPSGRVLGTTDPVTFTTVAADGG